MTPFWLGVITGGVFGAFFGVLVMALCVSSKNADLYAEIEALRTRMRNEEQMRHMEEVTGR